MNMEQWLEVTIRTASGGIDLLCAELTEAGFDSFVIDDSEQFRQFLDGARAYWDYVDEKLAARMRDLSQVRLYLPEETAEAQLAELRALLAELPGRYPACEFGPLTLALDRIPDEDWANSWKQNYRPLPVGERLLVVPQWMTVDDLQGRLPVILDLGLTFGTGEHASTQLCMRALESLLHGGERVADLGSGSGILSVSALRLGAASAVGVDIDPSISPRRMRRRTASARTASRRGRATSSRMRIFCRRWRATALTSCAPTSWPMSSSVLRPLCRSSCGRMRRSSAAASSRRGRTTCARRLLPPGWRSSMRRTRVNGAA